jgi:acyl-CoA thioesterase I
LSEYWLGRAVGVLLAAGCFAAACAWTTTGSTVTAAASTAKAFSIVALGDSVPRGTNCRCTPYPPLTATGLSKTTGDKVIATNDSVGGYTTKNVLNQLNNNEDVINHVKKADVVEIEIGANDVAYSSTCGTSVDCYAPKVPTMRENLLSIVRRTQSLVSGHKHVLVLLDYWSVWLGGKYAANKGQAYVAAAEEMTDRVDSAIQSTASRTRSAYVDLRAAFKGPSYSYDETHYLSNDGDHPNAAGHQKIADATEAVIEKRVVVGVHRASRRPVPSAARP